MSNSITNIDGLSRFDNDGIEIFISSSGESFASIRGVARMAEKGEATIRYFIGAQKIYVISVEVPTPGGFQGAQLLPESSICKVLREYNPDRLEQFAMLGIRTALQQIAGYRGNHSVQPKRLSSKDLNLEQLMVQGGFWFVPTDEHLKFESGREHLHLTPEKYAEIKASIDPIFDSLQQDAIDNLIAILEHPIKVAAFEKEMEEAEDLYIQKLENPDKHFLFYLKEVFADRNLTNAQILEELLDDRAGELEEEIETLHHKAFEDEMLIGATAKFEQRIDRLELAASIEKGLGFGKKLIGGSK